MDLTFQLPELRFYWRHTDKVGSPLDPVANSLAFEFAFGSELQLSHQTVNRLLGAAIDRGRDADVTVGDPEV